MRNLHYWTEDEHLIVRRDYDGTNQSARSIAARLGVTFFSVKGKVQTLGLAKMRQHRWTPEEGETLAGMINRYAPMTIARKLHRSPNAVILKAKKMNLSRRDRDGWYTETEVCEILGVDHHWLRARIDSGVLKAKRHDKLFWHIEESDLRKFIIDYSPELNGRHCDIIQLIVILAKNEKQNVVG